MLGGHDDSLTFEVDLDLLRGEPLDVDDQLKVVILHLGHRSRLSQSILFHLESIIFNEIFLPCILYLYMSGSVLFPPLWTRPPLDSLVPIQLITVNSHPI